MCDEWERGWSSTVILPLPLLPPWDAHYSSFCIRPTLIHTAQSFMADITLLWGIDRIVSSHGMNSLRFFFFFGVTLPLCFELMCVHYSLACIEFVSFWSKSAPFSLISSCPTPPRSLPIPFLPLPPSPKRASRGGGWQLHPPRQWPWHTHTHTHTPLSFPTQTRHIPPAADADKGQKPTTKLPPLNLRRKGLL